jgi:hypothetical protein
MMKNDKYLWIRMVLSALVLLLAILRFAFFEIANERMDSICLLLIASAILIFFLPWERLKSLKAGGIELSLDQPQVRGAIDSLGLNRVENKQLREKLSRRAPEIEQVKGSRVLWIDDRPHNILGERRLLRVLGIEVVTAVSSEMAEEILFRDNDFDMIISDVQRKGESYKLNDGIPNHEGVNFIVKLRKGHLFSLNPDYKQYLKDSIVYLFSWDSVPGDDNEKLIRFLRDDFDMEWVENAEIRKCNDDMTISISKDENSAEILMDENKEKAILKIRDGRTYNLEVKTENSKLNIYGIVIDVLKKAFEDNNRSLSRRASISKMDEKCWDIVDYSMRYRIKDTGTALNIYDEYRIINSLPVIFYAAYDWKKLVKYTRPVREDFPPEAELSNSIEMLVTKVIIALSEIRSNPIPTKLKKEPTPAT